MRDYGECICNIKQKLADAWNMANEAIKKVKVNGTVYSPDGTGTVDLGTIETVIPTASEVPSTDGNVQTDIDGIKASVTANATAIATETAERTDADDVLKNDLDLLSVEVAKKQDALTAGDGIAIADNVISSTVDVSGIATNASAISDLQTAVADETTARQDADTAIQTTLNKALVGGSEIADVDYWQQTSDDVTTDYARVSPMQTDGTRPNNWLYTKAVQGKGISLADSGGNNLVLSVKDAPASEVNLTDGRDVDTAIGSIDDEIGSETDSGSILYRIKTNETAISDETTARQNEDTALASDIADNATAIANEVTARTEADNTLQTAIDEINGSISTNASNIASNKTEIDANAAAIAGKQDALTAGDGIAIADNVISSTVDVSGIATNASAISDLQTAVTGKQDTLSAGDGISIADNVVSNSGVTSIVAGDNITIDNSTGAVTINAEGGGTEYTAGNGIAISDNAISTIIGNNINANQDFGYTYLISDINFGSGINSISNGVQKLIGKYWINPVTGAKSHYNYSQWAIDVSTGLYYNIATEAIGLDIDTDSLTTINSGNSAYYHPTKLSVIDQWSEPISKKQDILTAGDGISISDDNVISCTATGSGTTVPTITTYNSLTEFRAALQYGDEVLIRAPFTITQVGNPNTSYTNQAMATLRLIAQDTDTLIGSIVLPYTTSLTSKVGIVVNTGDITITDTQLSFRCWYINYNGPGQWTAIITPASGYSESNYVYRIIRH